MVSGKQQDGADRVGQAACGPPAERVERALALMEQGLRELVAGLDDGGLEAFGALPLVGFLQRWERHRNAMPVVDDVALAQAEAKGLPATLTQSNLTRVLVQALRISAGEAHRRVRAGEALGPRVTMLGERLEPRRPVLAAAQRDGEVTPEQVQVIARALEQADRPGFAPALVAAGESLLTGQAAVFEPKVLGQLADQVVAAIDPDGSLPDEQLASDRRHLSLRATKDGSYVGEFRLTGVAGAKLVAVLRPLAQPRLDTQPAAEGAGRTATLLAATDERTSGQRLHDALEDVCDRVLRSGTLPDSGGVPATVIVTVSEADLRRRVGLGRTADGVRLSIRGMLELAEQAHILPTVLSGAGAVVAQGRNRRIATPSQTLALVARDGGCSFPGCDRAPEWCERHHIVPWADGGSTDLDNLTLLCRYHHHQFEQRGWVVALNPDRLPEWRPPRWLDRQQRPLLHARIRQRQLAVPTPTLPVLALAGSSPDP